MSEIVKAALTDLEPELQPISVEERLGGVAAEWRFPNGYGASVINHMGSYGTELAVLYHGSITYDTPIANDVIGHIASPAELIDLLRAIRALES